jgi:membrane fusion protein (multidrug efflux system)
VDAVEARLEPVQVFIDAIGSLEAAEDVLISSEVEGLVKDITFEEGTPVAEGKVLVHLDDEMALLEKDQAAKRLDRLKAALKSMEAQHRRAEALEKNARSNFDRKKSLLDQDATTEAVFMDAQAEYESALAAVDQAVASVEESRRSILEAQAGLKIAEERLEDYTIMAPFDGTLGERYVGPGDYVDKGRGLVRLVAVNPLKLDFTVPERYQGRLHLEQAVALAVEAYPGRKFKGEVIYIAPSLDPETRSVKVKARVENDENLLRPGFFCRVRLVLQINPNAVVIPEEAVIPRGEVFFVYTVEEGKAVLREITLGQRMAGKVEILKGIEAGEQVITAGHQKASNGFPVRVRQFEQEPVEKSGPSVETPGAGEGT